MKTTDDQSEMFIVVDKRDVVLGYKSRYECHHDPSLIHRAINVALFNKKGEIALQKRSLSKDLYPGYYALTVTGHVSKNESYRDAALREMKEEVGIEGIKIEAISTDLICAPGEREMVTLFKGVYDGAFKTYRPEVESMHFFSQKFIGSVADHITPCSYHSLQVLGWL